jgi:hypothetical protein
MSAPMSSAGTAQQAGITTTTIGVGEDYDESLLSRMADSGGGGSYFTDITKTNSANAVRRTNQFSKSDWTTRMSQKVFFFRFFFIAARVVL